ncbi:MAG: nicotinate phosphoribosyltransferase [Gammaproteobacteria bacterium]|nr:nicotinate phosphoribosyltransferase [Gammaproteobacteria bacterium]
MRDDALLTDLYQLTMLQAYRARGMDGTAVFEFFVRKLPETRGVLVAAGLEQAVAYLRELRFSDEDLAFLRASGHFDDAFVDDLAGFRFTGDVDAMPEGTVCFANEPLLRVTAPLPQAQLVESRLINLLHLQTLVASKAVRCVMAAGKRTLVDFGMRRAHGAEAALHAARAAYLAGFTGTATVAAGKAYGIPLFGTMAHSFIQAHGDERAAFRDFALCHPDNVVLLIDTYDSEAGARKVVSLAPELARRGIPVKAVRIDSGDLGAMSRRVRAILDDGGLRETGIFCSGNLDEYRIARLVADGAPIDGFGVGTHLTTSNDAPYLDCVYKMQEYAGTARRKTSPGKATWPGRKQVWRRHDADGRARGDVVTLADGAGPARARALLEPVLRGGERVAPAERLAAARERTLAQVDALPETLRRLAEFADYPVEISDDLRELAERVDRDHAATG